MPKAKNRKTVILRCEEVNGRAVFAAADEFTRASLKQKGIRPGDEVSAEIRHARNPKFHRLVHQFGTLVGENIEAFAGLIRPNGRPDSHAILKRLQIEGDIGCSHLALNFPGVGPVDYRQAESIAFENMEEDEFQAIFAQFCDYVRRRYWPELEEGAIERMAEFYREAA